MKYNCMNHTLNLIQNLTEMFSFIKNRVLLSKITKLSNRVLNNANILHFRLCGVYGLKRNY